MAAKARLLCLANAEVGNERDICLKTEQLKHEIYLNDIQSPSFYLTGSTARLHSKDQPSNGESYGIHQHTAE